MIDKELDVSVLRSGPPCNDRGETVRLFSEEEVRRIVLEEIEAWEKRPRPKATFRFLTEEEMKKLTGPPPPPFPLLRAIQAELDAIPGIDAARESVTAKAPQPSGTAETK